MNGNPQDTESKMLIQNTKPLPTTYFDLVEKVGSNGKYQRNIFFIFILVFICTGTILMSSSFIFMNNQFICQQEGLLVNDCQKTICSLTDEQKRLSYFTKNKQKIQSIATEYGPFICEDEYLLDMIKSFPYLGSLIGFTITSLFSDNVGRKLTMSVSLFVAVLGSVMMSIGFNLWVIGIGVILSGAGINVASAMSFVYLGEIVQTVARQKYSILVQVTYTFGTMCLTGCYFLIGRWRTNTIILQTVPLIITFILFLIYAEDTPIYLLKETNQKALKALNRIGQINFGQKEILTSDDIQNVKLHEVNKKDHNKNQKSISPMDLFKFASLRKTTILSCSLGYVVLTMYYGPALIIDTIGFNTYVSSFTIQFSQMIGYIPCYFLIDKINRRMTGFYLLLVSAISSLILVNIQKPQNCDFCVESVIEIVVIFVFRFVIGIYFVLFLVYIVELFPLRAVGIGVSAVNMGGTIATTLGPIILGYLSRLQFNLMLFFFILGIIGSAIALLLKQTHNKPIESQIQELSVAKKQPNLTKQTQNNQFTTSLK